MNARKFVESIADEHGYLGEEILSGLDPEKRRKIEMAMFKKDKMAGLAVTTLTTNLYSSSARFVFELLQNADGNSYSIAKLHSIDPFVSFRVYNDRIVIDCNEDGLTREKLSTICNVGQSSKTGARGYIGEKGIGFKSVFMVAWKIHIQSGDFSFCFKHKLADSGVGMLIPIWEETEKTVPSGLTRMTLFFQEEVRKHRQTAIQQFADLKATFLLFAKNLRKVEVQIHDEDDKQVSLTIYEIEKQPTRVVLMKTVIADGDTQDYTDYYHLTRGRVDGLPKTGTQGDSPCDSRGEQEAEIILAFPLNEDFTPIVQPQEFLIHTDFDMDANRQDTVSSSPRNARLISHIGAVFIQAVKEFCNHLTLRYQWMRYLPRDTQSSGEGFFTTVLGSINTNLGMTGTIWTVAHTQLRGIRHVRRIGSKYLDQHGEPLLPDTDSDRYIACGYSGDDLNILQSYGLGWLEADEFLNCVREDLNKGDLSIMHQPTTDDDWHTRVADNLIAAWPKFQDTIRTFELIPLRHGGLISGRMINESVSYSTTSGYLIPQDLHFRQVDPKAEQNSQRKQLFTRLGVREVHVRFVRDMISAPPLLDHLSIGTSRDFLHFLYLTSHLDPYSDSRRAYNNIKLMDTTDTWRNPAGWTLYLPGLGSYSSQELLQGRRFTTLMSNGQNLDVSVLDPSYLRDSPKTPEGEHRTWKVWLKESLGVRDVITLVHKRELSKECLFVAEHHPDKFVGFLLKHWTSDGGKIVGSTHLIKQLLKIKVPCENGQMYDLGETCVCTPEREDDRKFLREGELFPWLKQDIQLDGNRGFSDIRVLMKDLGFGMGIGQRESNIYFYVSMLHHIAKANPEPQETPDIDRVYDLYARIQELCKQSGSTDIFRQHVRREFASKSLICIPAHGSSPPSWAASWECLWRAPSYMQWRYPLGVIYADVKNSNAIAEFFENTLSIRDVNTDDLIEELEILKDNGHGGLARARSLYRELNQELNREMRLFGDRVAIEEMRDYFQAKRLIYHKANNVATWYKPSQCVWSTTTDIEGRARLNTLYGENLSNFFMCMGVPRLTLQMIYDKLIRQGAGDASLPDVKKTIQLLNVHLSGEKNPPSNQRLRECKFPVKHADGTVGLCSLDVDFAVRDQKDLANLFDDKARFLDFEVDDISQLKSFLEWAELDRRYLSFCVKERSTVSGHYHRVLDPPDRNISLKARGLLRIAAHLQSPRLAKDEAAFYNALKQIKVYETDGITSEVCLSQDGSEIKVKGGNDELHLEENEDGLIIYVTQDPKAQYICFLDRVPRELLQWIMTNPSTGVCLPLRAEALNYVYMVLHVEPDEIPSNIVIRKVGARNWLGAIGAAWGLIMLGMGFVHSWQSLAVLRAFLGVLEAVDAEFPARRGKD
ncbi:hypothetical protein BJX99DRAFT_258658 [Aspergillus californicus]